MSIQTASPTESERKGRSWLRIFLWILGVLVGILLVAAVAFVIWASATPDPMPEAMAALESDGAVSVVVGDPITFTPQDQPATCGFVFYPGGRVDYRSYAPAMRAIAEAGNFVAVPHAPLNLMVLASNKADDVIAAHPEIDHWVIGGHSLGGAMAASYVYNAPDAADGLVLWAAFPTGAGPLSDRTDLAASSISGSLDGLATPDDIEASRALLPPQTKFVEIQGGNHAQFGWYGAQNRDNVATITRADQQAQAVAATLATLEAACAP